ncbi:MAG: hypothetical protein F6K47_04205 [Symploca sp. SIO2E6]|nr:hypothetical protein [Symploca sp. SIO2E6]
MTRELTPKEQKVVQAFEAANPGLGAVAQQNILNPTSGWSETIADMDEADIPEQASSGSARNSFMYRRIG